MKVRSGFVSNSSSSSFVVYGICTDNKKLNELYDAGINVEYGDVKLDVEYGEYQDVYVGLTITAEHEHCDFHPLMKLAH